jgi:hypothetical protein
MENRFDDLTKTLAVGIPRRQALRRLAGLFGGALLSVLTFSGLGSADQGGCPQGTCKVMGKCEPASVVGTPCTNWFLQVTYCCPGQICSNGVCLDKNLR